MSAQRSRSRSQKPQSKKIYISNLSPDTTQSQVRELCEEYGTIVSQVSLKKKGEDITFAFVQYTTTRQAEKAIAGLNRSTFNSRQLKVQFARGNKDNRGNYRPRGGPQRGGYRSRGGDRDQGPRNYEGRRQNQKSECYNCHGFGHFARQCTKPRENQGFRGRDNRGGRQGGYDRNRGYDREKGDRYDNRQRDRSRQKGDRYDRDRNQRDRSRSRDRNDRYDRDRNDRDRQDRDRDRRRRSRSRSSSGGDRRRPNRNDDY